MAGGAAEVTARYSSCSVTACRAQSPDLRLFCRESSFTLCATRYARLFRSSFRTRFFGLAVLFIRRKNIRLSEQLAQYLKSLFRRCAHKAFDAVCGPLGELELAIHSQKIGLAIHHDLAVI